jgi:hypothetical protein
MMNLEVLQQRLKLYGRASYNVLLTGKHGVGKTAIIKSVFDELFGSYGTNWLYFSSSTLDPWIDFIGVPKTYTRQDGLEVFKIVPPEHLADNNTIKAMFFDELNRADEKTLNATMELIQFKSINGRKFPALQCVWAAENPADDKENEYSVKPLDPAQKDRFQIQIEVPQELNRSYFNSKYGTEIAKVAEEWWKANKKMISPRKLDNMLHGFNLGFSLQDFTRDVNTSELTFSLKNISKFSEILNISLNSTDEEKKKYFSLNLLRENEKVIRKNNNGKDLFENIYDILPGEVQEYVTETFKFKRYKQIPGAISSVQIQSILDKYSAVAKRDFNNLISGQILDYILDFNYALNQNDLIENDPSRYRDVFQQFISEFPFKFTSSFGTYAIKEFESYVAQKTKNSDLLQTWVALVMFMFSYSDMSATDMKKTDLYQVLLKLTGCKFFVQPVKINKIFFNEWKVKLPRVSFDVYKKRIKA